MHTRCQDTTGASSPFPELADPPGDYELSIWIHFAYDRYDRDATGQWPPVITGDYVQACGRENGRWRLTSCPNFGEHDEEDILGTPVANLSDQARGLQPLTMLRALLAGRLV
jgi:hypothetical protein